MTLFSDNIRTALEIKKPPQPALEKSLGEIHYYHDMTKTIGCFAVPIKWTPEMAEHYLNPVKNPNNRRLHLSKIEKYAKDIVAGDFIENGETIVLANDDTLMDGQNRLSAVVRSGKSIRSLTAFGYDRSVMRSFDQGDARTLSDIMSTTGWDHTDVKRAAAALTLYVGYHRNKIGKYMRGAGTAGESNQFMMEKFDEYRDVLLVGMQAKECTWVIKQLHSSAITAWMILGKIDKKACTEFFDSLNTGANLPSGSPILQFRDHLVKIKQRANNMSVVKAIDLKRHLRKPTDIGLSDELMYGHASMLPVYGEQKMELIFRYWNLWRQGRKVRHSERLIGEYPVLL